jgi:hypothetical protein
MVESPAAFIRSLVWLLSFLQFYRLHQKKEIQNRKLSKNVFPKLRQEEHFLRRRKYKPVLNQAILKIRGTEDIFLRLQKTEMV